MSRYTIYITRIKEEPTQTLGIASVIYNGIIRSFTTIELPYKDNKCCVSCIKPGVYNYEIWYSPTFKTDVIRLLDVEGRSNILIHPANFVKELQGCIAIGKAYADLNKDGKLDVAHSRKALEELISYIPKEGTIYINYADTE